MTSTPLTNDELIRTYAVPEAFRYLEVPSSWLCSVEPTATFRKQRPTIIDYGIRTINEFCKRFPENDGEIMLRRYLSLPVGKRFQASDGYVIAQEKEMVDHAVRNQWTHGVKKPTLEEFRALYPTNVIVYDGTTRILFSQLESSNKNIVVDPDEPVHMILYPHDTPQKIMVRSIDNPNLSLLL